MTMPDEQVDVDAVVDSLTKEVAVLARRLAVCEGILAAYRKSAGQTLAGSVEVIEE